jgi:3-isopropylmalate/(R)-2-methylmalate dehydratase small subunit
MMPLHGKAHVYGDNIDTDRIIPGKYTKTLDLNELAAHCLEDLDPSFRARMQAGDWIVAGDNFGCGSSREQAPLALRTVGVSGVIAKYFARIFFRNAINIGLPVLEVPDFEAVSGDEIAVDLATGRVENVTRGKTYRASALPAVMLDILQAGGLVAYLQKHGTYKTAP